MLRALRALAALNSPFCLVAPAHTHCATPCTALPLPPPPHAQVGPAPPDMPLHVYCMRLKEQGWNIDRTIRKAQQCGMILHEQATGV